MAEDYCVTVQELASWNPWVGDDPEVGVFAGLEYYDKRALCVGVNASGPFETAKSAPDTVKTEPVEGCKVYHKVKPGDSCSLLLNNHNLIDTEFLSMNPQGKSMLTVALQLGRCSPRTFFE